MTETLAAIVGRLVVPRDGRTLSGISASDQFQPDDVTEAGAVRNLNAAFLLELAGEGWSANRTVGDYLEAPTPAGPKRELTAFYMRLADWVRGEFEAISDDPAGEAARTAAAWCLSSVDSEWDREAQHAIWSALFPEGVPSLTDPVRTVADLRAKRTVRVTRLNPDPLRNPTRELLLTSNVLITLPHDARVIPRLPYSPSLRARLEQVVDERQRYWFDHPIHIGVETDANEVVYGLKGLNEAVAFEKQRGIGGPDDKLTVVLSVSVTHQGLAAVAGEYLREALSQAEATPHLEVYAFTERDVDRLIAEVLAPAASELLDTDDLDALRLVLGVDGEYGRHYSFLKAVAAFWQVLVNPDTKATFKIDLDQVFPQPELVGQGGGSAFEHFQSPLWGAEGIDADGRPVVLGMLAGALVNEKDIGHGLFTPDVTLPAAVPSGEATVFYNRFPMAVSTEAEMMARYNGELDGVERCLHRIHVTGGTNGILVDHLRRHRPFTPTFIGRAEDQAYLMSVLFAGERHLRYAHRSGLIMRHDKEAFAGDSIKAAKSGRFIGDLARTLYFSRYARILPWGNSEIKGQIDPFTGCFASAIPITLVALRLALAIGERFESNSQTSRAEAVEIARLASDRLGRTIEESVTRPRELASRFARERRGWDLYYEILDALEQTGDSSSFDAWRDRARGIVAGCKVR